MEPKALSLSQEHSGHEQQEQCNLNVEIQAWQIASAEH
jgi:hypothetical protein